jgi:hypothetical protein
MEHETTYSIPEVGEREERFLNRLSNKYEKSEAAGRFRSYLIASVVIMAMFAASRWIPWWGIAFLVVEAVGLTLFHQYKLFANFKSRLLRKLWCRLMEVSKERTGWPQDVTAPGLPQTRTCAH